jgi:hypothetical protein
LDLGVLVLIHVKNLTVLVNHNWFQVDLLWFGSDAHLILKAHDFDVGD